MKIQSVLTEALSHLNPCISKTDRMMQLDRYKEDLLSTLEKQQLVQGLCTDIIVSQSERPPAMVYNTSMQQPALPSLQSLNCLQEPAPITTVDSEGLKQGVFKFTRSL